MTAKLTAEVLSFLKQHHDGTSAVLLGYSGGPDSLALLHLLLEISKVRPLRIGLAHVDHGWRPESRAEAEIIRTMAVALGLPVYIKTLSFGEMDGNPEAVCREERLKFFASLCHEHGYQAVMLAHHADDLAETVLKRIFEGAALSHLGGIKPTSRLFGVDVWRPLLKITKKEILHWLQERNLVGFHDHTNFDPKFLRTRLRLDVLPTLSRIFGKEVGSGLCHIGNESAELIEYLDANIASYLARTISGPFGSFLDLSRIRPQALLELKHLIRRFCERKHLSLSRESLRLAAELVSTGAANKYLGNGGLHIDRHRIFLFNLETAVEDGKVMQDFKSESVMLPEEGVLQWGPWRVEVNRGLSRATQATDWVSIWKGEGCVTLPVGCYKLSVPDGHMIYSKGTTLAKLWTNHKVPAFLRPMVPVILSQDGVVHEFLTGKAAESKTERFCVTLSY